VDDHFLIALVAAVGFLAGGLLADFVQGTVALVGRGVAYARSLPPKR